MNDQKTWEQAVLTTSDWYFGLPSDKKAELDELLDEIMQFKQKLVELVTSSGSSSICRTCGGQCCLLGRYHFSVLDILAYRKTGVEPVIPDFTAKPTCPYSDVSGCLMSARYRPVTCVIFNCDSIEDRLSVEGCQSLNKYESSLRAAVTRAESLHDIRINRPLLLSCC